MLRSLGSTLWILGALGCVSGTVDEASAGGSGSGAGSASGTAAAGSSSGLPPPVLTGTLAIVPESPVLTVSGGIPATLALTAVLVSAGKRVSVSASWSSSRPEVAAIDPVSGLVVASGPRGGPVQISASVSGQSAAVTLTVVVAQTVSNGLPPTVVGAFAQTPTTGSGGPALLYPEDGTVIPVNLQPLNIQWEPGAGNDTFRITFAGPYGTLVGYTQPAPAADGGLEPAWQPDPAVWVPFAESNIGQTVTLDVAAVSSAAPGPVSAAPTTHLTLAASRFAGTVYYWTVSGGAVLRIQPGTAAPQVAYTPPQLPAASGAPPTGNTCLACHAISNDGTTLSAEVWGGGQPGTVVDLTQAPPTALVSPGPELWLFSAFGPTPTNNAQLLLLTSYAGALTLRDARTAQPFPAGSGEANQGAIGCGAAGACTQPAWSRDGRLMAFAQGVTGTTDGGAPFFSGDVSFTATDLMLSHWDPVGKTFSTPALLAAHDFDGRLLANFYPSVSSDDSLVAFTRSSCSYGCDQVQDQLLIVSPDGGAPIELARAEGSADLRNRFPNFSPFKEGGYHWMTFYSQRDYGWVTRGQGQRQVWVAAVDAQGNPSSDPSHPAFWLPGQDPTTMNDKAEWATLPCVSTGEGCQGDIDCCGGLVCRATDGGTSQCLPTSQACGYVGSTCQASSDCCQPFTCAQGACGIVQH